MANGWYVLHVYTGYENKVERLIRLLMEDGEVKERVLDIKVPAEEVVEVRNGKKRTVLKKFLPGYVLLEMDLPDLGWKRVCSEIRRLDGVTGFVGTSKDVKPQPISDAEMKNILQKAGDIKVEKKYKGESDFVTGEEIKIKEGPFESFSGKVDEVFPERGKLRVLVGIFGRSTPVELGFDQVERL